MNWNNNANENYKAKEMANNIEIFFMKNKKIIMPILFFSVSFLIYLFIWAISRPAKEDLQSKLVEIEYNTIYNEDPLQFRWSERIETKWVIWVKKVFFDENEKVYFEELDCEECKSPVTEILVKWTFDTAKSEFTVKQEFNNFLFWIKNREYKKAIWILSYKSQKNVDEDRLLLLEQKSWFKFWDFYIKEWWIKANLEKTDAQTVDIKAKTYYNLDWLWKIDEIINLQAVYNKKKSIWEFDYPFIYKRSDVSSKKLYWRWITPSTINRDRIVIKAKLMNFYRKIIWKTLMEMKVQSSIPIWEIETTVMLWLYDSENRKVIEKEIEVVNTSFEEFDSWLAWTLNQKQIVTKTWKREYLRTVYIWLSNIKEWTVKKWFKKKYLRFIFKPKTIWYNMPEFEIKTSYTSLLDLK